MTWLLQDVAKEIGCVPPLANHTCLSHHMSVPRGMGPQVNKFEQVPSNFYQMSLAWDWDWVPMPGVWGRSQEDGGMYSEVQSIIGNGHMRTSHVNR